MDTLESPPMKTVLKKTSLESPPTCQIDNLLLLERVTYDRIRNISIVDNRSCIHYLITLNMIGKTIGGQWRKYISRTIKIKKKSLKLRTSFSLSLYIIPITNRSTRHPSYFILKGSQPDFRYAFRCLINTVYTDDYVFMDNIWIIGLQD